MDAGRRAIHYLHLHPNRPARWIASSTTAAPRTGAHLSLTEVGKSWPTKCCRRSHLTRSLRSKNVDHRLLKHRHCVMMGRASGERTLLNLAAVLKATRLLIDPKGMAISARRITVSTSGIIPKIHELGQAEVRPKLAISLNASTEEQRRELMPITRKYHLKDLLEACRVYPLRPWEKLTFEYVLLKGVNDTDADARRVAKFLANLKAKVNLIALNPGPGIPYEPPALERVASFQTIVRRSLDCFIRRPRGLDVYAACGQLKRMEMVQIQPRTT